MKRRVYTPEFKHQSVERVIKDDFTVKQVARSFKFMKIHSTAGFKMLKHMVIILSGTRKS